MNWARTAQQTLTTEERFVSILRLRPQGVRAPAAPQRRAGNLLMKPEEDGRAPLLS
jgi:hypothetical protein